MFRFLAISLLDVSFLFLSLVDASLAGEGSLQISINKGEIANEVTVLDRGKCSIEFTPDTEGEYVVEIK